MRKGCWGGQWEWEWVCVGVEGGYRQAGGHTHRFPGLRVHQSGLSACGLAVCVQVYPHRYYTAISHGIWWQGFKIRLPPRPALSPRSLVQLQGALKEVAQHPDPHPPRPRSFTFSYLHSTCLPVAWWGVSGALGLDTHAEPDTHTHAQADWSTGDSFVRIAPGWSGYAKCEYVDLSLLMWFVCGLESLCVCPGTLRCQRFFFFLSDIIKKRNPSKKSRNLHETVFVARAGRQWTKNRFCAALSLKFSITQGRRF